MTELRDWKTWFDAYDGPLTSRLKAVRDGIGKALDEAPEGPIRILSLCAADGRDLIPVLAEHPRRDDVIARQVELDPEIAAAARRAVAEAGLEGVVEVIASDDVAQRGTWWLMRQR